MTLLFLILLLGAISEINQLKERECTITYIKLPAKEIKPQIEYTDLYINIDDWEKENIKIYTKEELSKWIKEKI